MENTEYLQRFLENLEHVPPYLAQEFRIMRDLDQKVHNVFSEIQSKTSEYIEAVPHLSPSEKRQRGQHIKSLFSKAQELSEDKVARAENAYELVDKQIQRLDSDLYEFKKSLAVHEEQATQKGRRSSSRKHRQSNSADQHGPNLPATAALALALTHNPDQVLDMPVDPNEPRYCVCNQVSYGEMVACDNAHCPIEWFHFECMGLTSTPAGKWYCPKCAPTINKVNNKAPGSSLRNGGYGSSLQDSTNMSIVSSETNFI